MHMDDLELPVPVVDRARLEANITRLQDDPDEHNLTNRRGNRVDKTRRVTARNAVTW